MSIELDRRQLLRAACCWLALLAGPLTAARAKDGDSGGDSGGDDGGGDDGGDDGDGGNDGGGKGRGRGRGRGGDDDGGGKGRGRGGRNRGDEDKAARAGGASLKQALSNVRSRFPGRVVEVELDRYRGRKVYEIKVIDIKGRLFEIYCDVRNGNIVKVDRD